MVGRQIGYLAGDFMIDGRQSARDLLVYLANLRGGAGRRRIAELADQLELNLGDRIAAMSKGIKHYQRHRLRCTGT